MLESTTTYAAMMLSLCLMERPLVANSNDTKTTPYPHVVCDTDVFSAQSVYTVYADNTEITTCSDIVTALTVCFDIYWIFDIQYPKHYRNVLSLLDIAVFRKRSVKAPQKVITLLNKF